MSELLEIRKQIDTANARVLSLERALSEHPELPSIAANLDSAVRIKAKLEAQFADAAEKLGHDICSYRAFDELDKPKAGAAFAAISRFQRLVSVVYGALVHGVKQRATIPERVERETAFDLGYAFAGSVGVVLTIRGERGLFEWRSLDETFDTIASMAKASASDDITAFATRLGPGPINALYEWANEQASSGLGADIEWRRGQKVQRSLFVQRQEWSKLRTVIEETSGEEETTETVIGVLKMADVDKNKFKLKPDGLPMVQGTLEPGIIDEHHAASLPKKYSVLLRKIVRFQYAKGQEVTRYHILKLSEPPHSQMRLSSA
jgi:hypothetical protein